MTAKKIKVNHPAGGTIEVTQRAYDVVYAQHGYTLADAETPKAPQGGEQTGGQPQGDETGGERLTAEQYEEVMKNRDNVEKRLGEMGIEYDKTAKADDLRELLKKALDDQGLTPDGY